MQMKHAALATLLAGGAVIGVSSLVSGPQDAPPEEISAAADLTAEPDPAQPVVADPPPPDQPGPDVLLLAAEAERDRAVADLLAAQTERDALAAALAERDAAVAAQAETAAGRDAEIARLTEALAAQSAEVDRLKAALDEQGLELAALRDAAKILPGPDDVDPVEAVAARAAADGPAPETPAAPGDDAPAAAGVPDAMTAPASGPTPAAPSAAVARPPLVDGGPAPRVTASAAPPAPVLRPVSAGPPMVEDPLAEVHFEAGSATLTPGAAVRAAEAARVLAARPPARILIAGHADTTGSEAANLRLSRARAEAVAAVLVSGGVPADLIEIEAFGQTADMLPVPTGLGVPEPLNRCVGIFPDAAGARSL